MKQGTANTSKGQQKREPIPHAVSPEAVDSLGQACAYTKYDLYKGRGYKAPTGGSETHRCGTQGKH